MVTNLQYFFETARKVRGGKWVWVKDSNGENRNNILLGGTIANPNKGFGHLWAAQLMQYTPGEAIKIFRSFKVQANAASNATTIYIEGDGFSDAPEVGQYLMVAPDAVKVVTSSADTTSGEITTTESDYTGTYAKVTGVVYDETNQKFAVTLANALGALTAGDILVEADAAADAALQSPTGSAKVLCPKPNIFNEADRDLLPTEGYGFQNANYSVSGVYNKQAWIAKMQPLPKYVLAYNKSLIDGIFWI
jgi:hypothetical protein